MKRKNKNTGFEELKKIKKFDDFKDRDTENLGIVTQIKNINQQKDNIDYIIKIKNIDKCNYNIDSIMFLIENTCNVLKRKYDFDLAQAKKKVENVLSKNETINEQWLKNGVKAIKEDICPFCGSDISKNNQVQGIVLYFSEQVINIIDEIEGIIEKIKKQIVPISIDNKIHKIEKQLQDIKQYINIDNDEMLRFEQLISKAINLVEEINSQIDNMRLKMINMLNEKLASIAKIEFDIKDIIDCSKKIQVLCNTTKIIDENIELFNERFICYKKLLNVDFLNKQITQLNEQYKANEKIVYRGTYDDDINEILSLEKDEKKFKDEIKELKKKIENNQDEFLQKYFNDIEEIFNMLGGRDFTISKEKIGGRSKKIVYGIKICFKGHIVDNMRYCLSESDRRALALAVFLAKLKLIMTKILF